MSIAPRQLIFYITLLLGAFLAQTSLASASSSTNDIAVRQLVEKNLPSLITYYTTLHAAPELSHQEAHTAEGIAQELRFAGFEVIEHIGKYESSKLKPSGVAGVLKNGPGPTVLIRADMDALPIEEKTGLPYASTRRMTADSGVEVPVMHACGHDIHVTSLVGVARVMSKLKNNWHGTLVLIGQPAEETMDGALSLLHDNLYGRIPKPDFALALHDSADVPAGSISLTPGYTLAMSTQMDVTVRGVSGHSSRPEAAKDPIVLAANIIMQLQTIVSREISPFDQAVLTVGTIHGGIKRNIIPDEVKLEINLRAYKEDVRQHLIEAVVRISRAAALGAGMPEDRLPVVRVIENEFAPALFNDEALYIRLKPAFERALGKAHVAKQDPAMAGEDFGHLGLERSIPVFMFWLGAATPEALGKAKASGIANPGLHSSGFAPDPEPTLRTGVIAMSTAALELLAH
jgi:hippurate hydrolase